MKNNTFGFIMTIVILVSLLNSAPLSGQVDSTYRFYFYDQRYSLFEVLETKPGQIIMLGNSITNGGNWSELLGNSSVINRGISGDNTFGVLNRLDEIVSSQPEKIFILIGINDLSRGTPVDVILNNYRRIVRRIQKDSPGTKIYVQSLFPTNNEFDQFSRAQNKDDEIRAVNKGIEEIAAEYELTFIDLYPHFLDEEGKLNKVYTNDGLHLMGEGYLKWADIIRPFLEESKDNDELPAFGGDYYDRRRAIHESVELTSGSIVMLGNSITEQGIWNELFPDVNIINRGIGGDNIAGMTDRLPAILAQNPSKIFIMGGINNLLFRNTDVQILLGEYENMIEDIMKINPDIDIYIQSLLPVNENVGESGSFLNDKNGVIGSFNQRLMKLAQQKEILFIDLHSRFADESGRLGEELTYDGLHLNSNGYHLWAEIIEKFVKVN